MNIFDKEMTRKSIFIDRNVLSPHFIPEALPHREEHINKIMTLLAPVLKKKRVHNLFLYGKTGTGKTSSTKYVIKKLLEAKEKYESAVDTLYINCRILNTKYQVMLKCASYCNPDEKFIGYPFASIYDQLLKYISGKETSMIVILDEVDKVKDVDDLMYTLTRMNDELSAGHCSIVGITNNITLKEKLDPRSRSTLCEEEIVFSPYNAEQLHDILQKRTATAFNNGVVEDSALNLTSALAAQESGDARYALKLIVKAGEIADTSENGKVTEEEIRGARKGVEDEIVIDIMETLPKHQKVVLYSIAKLISKGVKYDRLTGGAGDKVLFSGDVYDGYRRTCKKMALSARSARWVREYINDLEMLGLVTTTISGKGVRGTTTLVRLAHPADHIEKVLEKDFS